MKLGLLAPKIWLSIIYVYATTTKGLQEQKMLYNCDFGDTEWSRSMKFAMVVTYKMQILSKYSK